MPKGETHSPSIHSQLFIRQTDCKNIEIIRMRHCPNEASQLQSVDKTVQEWLYQAHLAVLLKGLC